MLFVASYSYNKTRANTHATVKKLSFGRFLIKSQTVQKVAKWQFFSSCMCICSSFVSYSYSYLQIAWVIPLAATWYQSLFFIHLFCWSYFAWQCPFTAPRLLLFIISHIFDKTKIYCKSCQSQDKACTTYEVTLVSLARGIRTIAIGYPIM